MRLQPLLAALAVLLALPVAAQEEEGFTSAPIIGVSLTDRVWVRSDETGLTGMMQLFLSDGTLLSTSCWEGYRLSSWYMLSDTEVTWEEDGMAINAVIEELNEAELILTLELVSESITQHFRAAPVPYVCPDMPR